MQIAVIGSGEAKGKAYTLTEEVGKEIAKAGVTLICGGLGGVMEASAKGAKEAGSLTIGILPGSDKREANKYIDVKVVTAMSHARNAIIARSADALIAVGGGLGTLSEVALGLKIGKPVIALEGTEIVSFSEGIIENIHIAKTPKEAVKLAIELVNEKLY